MLSSTKSFKLCGLPQPEVPREASHFPGDAELLSVPPQTSVPPETLHPQHPARGSSTYHHRGTEEKSKLGEEVSSKSQLDPEEVIRLELEWVSMASLSPNVARDEASHLAVNPPCSPPEEGPHIPVLLMNPAATLAPEEKYTFISQGVWDSPLSTLTDRIYLKSVSPCS